MGPLFIAGSGIRTHLTQVMVVAFEEAQRTQTKKKGEAQRKLSKWVGSCKKFAWAALQDDIELLEVLGIVVPQR